MVTFYNLDHTFDKVDLLTLNFDIFRELLYFYQAALFIEANYL